MKKKYRVALFILPVCISAIFQQCRNLTNEQNEQTRLPKKTFPEYSIYTNAILKTDHSIFRGLNLNVSSATIKQTETIQPFIEKPDTIEYHYTIDSMVYYTIRYSLQKDSLEEINVWVYSSNPDISTQIFNELKEYYRKKLPKPLEDKGYVVYNCVQGERRPFVVSLSDFSKPSKGQINLIIYKDL